MQEDPWLEEATLCKGTWYLSVQGDFSPAFLQPRYATDGCIQVATCELLLSGASGPEPLGPETCRLFLDLFATEFKEFTESVPLLSDNSVLWNGKTL